MKRDTEFLNSLKDLLISNSKIRKKNLIIYMKNDHEDIEVTR